MPAATASLDGNERFVLAQVAYKKMIKKYARDTFFIFPGYAQEDIENELLEVLWLACNTYDPDRGMKFNTYFRQKVKHKFVDREKSARRIKRAGDFNQVSLDVDAVRTSVEGMRTRDSAEDDALANIQVQELFRSGRKLK